MRDPSILHFLIAQGQEVSSKQLRDDLMTLLIAGHETNAAVLTWTFYLLSKHPDIAARAPSRAAPARGENPDHVPRAPLPAAGTRAGGGGHGPGRPRADV